MAPFITANFQVHSSLPALYSNTEGMSKKNKLFSLQGGSYLSVFLCSVLFLLVAVSGNITFDNVSSNILNDFLNPNSTTIDWHILVCRALMVVVVVIAYPLIMFPTCAGILRYIPKRFCEHLHSCKRRKHCVY